MADVCHGVIKIRAHRREQDAEIPRCRKRYIGRETCPYLTALASPAASHARPLALTPRR